MGPFSRVRFSFGFDGTGLAVGCKARKEKPFNN
jgi:hypothetical protein